MNLADLPWLVVGLLAQVAFSARFLVQWVLSERARRSLLPMHFWFFSVVGAVLLLAYAVHQRDPVIAVGQAAGLAIYLRNIELAQRIARGWAPGFIWPWLGMAGVAFTIGWYGQEAPLAQAVAERATPVWFALGFIGQVLFTGRFVLQWHASEQARAPVNPVQFWYLSLSGSLLLLAYALHTADAVIVLGQSFGLVVYLRNLALIRRQSAADRYGDGAARQAHEAAPDAKGSHPGLGL